MERFRFEEDEVFTLALEIAERGDLLALRVRRQRPWVASQLGRSSLSVLNNTAEAHGEHSRGDKARLYRYAARSATETAAMIAFIGRIGAIPHGDEIRLCGILLRTVKLLTRRAIHFQSRRP